MVLMKKAGVFSSEFLQVQTSLYMSLTDRKIPEALLNLPLWESTAGTWKEEYCSKHVLFALK